MRTRTAESAELDDAGITLIELLVYMFLAIVVLVMVGQFLINSLRVDGQVRGGAEAANNAQVASESLGRGIRNASAVVVTNPTVDSVLVRTRSIDSGADGAWYCNAWYVSDGELRWTRSLTPLPSNPDPATIASWTLMVENIVPADSQPIFALGSDERSLAVAMSVQNRDGAPILLQTTIVARQPIPVTGKISEPCF